MGGELYKGGYTHILTDSVIPHKQRGAADHFQRLIVHGLQLLGVALSQIGPGQGSIGDRWGSGTSHK